MPFTNEVNILLKQFEFDWSGSYKHIRDAIYLITRLVEARTYLEVGAPKDTYSIQCFNALPVKMKLTIDRDLNGSENINPTQKLQISSDDFFGLHALKYFPEGIDVVFIDGDHSYIQSRQDIINALQFLTSPGVILVHDCLPSSEYATGKQTFEEHLQYCSSLEEYTQAVAIWVGEVWKSIVYFRSFRSDVYTRVLNFPFMGLGVLFPTNMFQNTQLNLDLATIENLQWKDVEKDLKKFIGLTEMPYFTRVLSNITQRRVS